MLFMVIGSFLVQYVLMSIIMTRDRSHITNNVGKIYISVIMVLFMILLTSLVERHNTFSLIAVTGLVLFIYLYRKQIAINDKQYLENMIEHHSMALLTSEEILKKTDNVYVTNIARNIIQTQQDEIKEMRDLINKM